MQCSVEREGESICRIVGARDFLEVQEVQEHALHILFRCSSIAGDCELQLERCGLEDRAVQSSSGCKNDSPRVGDIHGAPNVSCKEEFLDDDDVGVSFLEECIEIISYLFEAFGEGHGFCSNCEPVGCPNICNVCHFDSTEADGRQAGVDTEDTHVDRV